MGRFSCFPSISQAHVQCLLLRKTEPTACMPCWKLDLLSSKFFYRERHVLTHCSKSTHFLPIFASSIVSGLRKHPQQRKNTTPPATDNADRCKDLLPKQPELHRPPHIRKGTLHHKQGKPFWLINSVPNGDNDNTKNQNNQKRKLQ